MRFVTFVHGGRERAGILLQSADGALKVLDGASPRRPMPLKALEPRMGAWVQWGLSAIAQGIKSAEVDEDALVPLEQVRLRAPLPRPGKIVGAAFNYRDGLALGSRPFPEQPVIFIKSSSTVVGPGDPVLVPPEADLTYEAELAAVIGRQALNVSRSQAMAHIAGYTLFNDVSATRYVRDDGGFVRGKNQPASGPLGPWIVLPEDIADPYDLPIRLEVDGNTLQDSNTSQMLHGIEALVAYISTQMPLDVGDIIATGTPAGVAAHHQPAAWLSRGQEVLIRSTPWFGELKNPVL